MPPQITTGQEVFQPGGQFYNPNNPYPTQYTPGQYTPAQPYEQPPVIPDQQGPYSQWQGPHQVPPATPAGNYLPGGPGDWLSLGFMGAGPQPEMGPPPNTPPPPAPPALPGYSPGAEYAGQSTVNPTAGPADYLGVQEFADQAYDANMRYLDPQLAAQDRRMEQELVNKGIDPTSNMGREMLQQMAREQNDARNSASFQALGFGQDIQNQMFGQDLSRSQLAANMQQSEWNNEIQRMMNETNRYGMGLDYQSAMTQAALANQLGKYQADTQYALGQRGYDLQGMGMGLDYALGQSGQDLQRYLGDQGYQLGMGGLDLSRQQQDYAELMGLEGMDFRNRQYADQLQQYQDQITMAMLGLTPVPGVSPVNPYDPYAASLTSAGQSGGIIGDIFD
jgi:hypothetical protein